MALVQNISTVMEAPISTILGPVLKEELVIKSAQVGVNLNGILVTSYSYDKASNLVQVAELPHDVSGSFVDVQKGAVLARNFILFLQKYVEPEIKIFEKLESEMKDEGGTISYSFKHGNHKITDATYTAATGNVSFKARQSCSMKFGEFLAWFDWQDFVFARINTPHG